MKKVLRIIGICLMIFNGLGVVVFLFNAVNLIKGMNGTVIENLLLFLLIEVCFACAAYGGYAVYLTGSPEQRQRRQERIKKKRQRNIEAKRQKQTGTMRSDQVEAKQWENYSRESAQTYHAGGNEIFAKVAGKDSQAQEESDLYTIYARYLELPAHDGDAFRLFHSRAEAEGYLTLRLGSADSMYVRAIIEERRKLELSEYLCCGYSKAILKEGRQELTLSDVELRERYDLAPLEACGNVLPYVLKRVHNYLNQVDYTRRRYGTDAASVPEHWQEHLRAYKAEAVQMVLVSDLLLPAKTNAEGKMTSMFMPTVQMPSGEQWGALFTDQFAIRRYMGAQQSSVVLPNLLADMADDIEKKSAIQLRQNDDVAEPAMHDKKNIAAGSTQDPPVLAGIMINPGREEFKITLPEIRAAQQWLKEHPGWPGKYLHEQGKIS